MKRALFVMALSILCSAACGGPASAAAAKLPDKPVGAERSFVRNVTATLEKLYPTTRAAKAAGYFRFTNEDRTGAISYVNPSYWNSDLQHPSQLWYSAAGRLLGADYSVPMARSTAKPVRWGVNPSRWFKFPAHVHWDVRLPNGSKTYDNATSVKKFTAAGGNVAHPSAAAVVKMRKAANAGEVTHVFAFPNLWDLELWVVPNPDGAFASSDPLVHPSKRAASGMM
jgi:hypothetical protein